jgi:hypothetical protein
LRLPRAVHAELAKTAARQGVSLNLLINTILAEYVGGERCSGSVNMLNEIVEQFKQAISMDRTSPRRDALRSWVALRSWLKESCVWDNPDPEASVEKLINSTCLTVMVKSPFIPQQSGEMLFNQVLRTFESRHRERIRK